MSTRIEYVQGPKGFHVSKDVIERDEMVWIKHINEASDPILLEIGEIGHFEILTVSARPSLDERISFNTMQRGLFVVAHKSERVSQTQWLHMFDIQPRSWTPSEKDSDPASEMIVRVHTSYHGTSGRTARDMRLHILVKEAAQEAVQEDAPKEEAPAVEQTEPKVHWQPLVEPVDAPSPEPQETAPEVEEEHVFEKLEPQNVTLEHIAVLSRQGKLYKLVD